MKWLVIPFLLTSASAAVPILFEPNLGQAPGPALFLAQARASYLGGSAGESGSSTVVDPDGNVIAILTMTSGNLKVTSGAFQARFSGGQTDIHIARIELVTPYTRAMPDRPRW